MWCVIARYDNGAAPADYVEYEEFTTPEDATEFAKNSCRDADAVWVAFKV